MKHSLVLLDKVREEIRTADPLSLQDPVGKVANVGCFGGSATPKGGDGIVKDLRKIELQQLLLLLREHENGEEGGHKELVLVHGDADVMQHELVGEVFLLPLDKLQLLLLAA